MRPLWFVQHGAVLAGLVAVSLLVACGDDDDDDGGSAADEVQEVETIARQVLESTGEGDNAEFFFEHVTDNAIETVLFASRDECQAAPVECIGEPLPIESLSGTTVDGDSASTVVVSPFGTFDAGLVREDGVWKFDSFQAGSDDVPDGATMVDLRLVEFGFDFEPSEIPSGQSFAFHVRNDGEQVHEVVVVRIPEGSTLEEAVELVGSEQEPPLALKVYIQSGQELDMAFAEPLEAGDYALVCFFPDTDDPNFAAHIEKGMVSEFTVE